MMLAKDVCVFPLQDHLVVARTGDRTLFLLNETARVMWELLTSGLDEDEVAFYIAEGVGLPFDTVRAEVETALVSWRAIGILDPDTSLPGVSADRKRACPHVKPPDQWLSAADYALWGAAFTLRTGDEAMTDLLCPLLDHLRAGAGAVSQATIDVWPDGNRYIVACNGAVTGSEPSAGDALTCVLEAVARCAAPGFDPVAVLHASAVSDGQGVAVLAAPAGHGKSTLTAALGHAGLIYFGDDALPLVEGGAPGASLLNAVAMPLAICLKDSSWRPLTSRYPELPSQPVYRRFGRDVRYLVPGEFDNSDAHGVPVGCLLFPHYQRGRQPTLMAISPVEALQRLVTAQAWLSFEPDRLDLLLKWLAHVPAYALEYGSSAQGISLVTRALRGAAKSGAGAR